MFTTAEYMFSTAEYMFSTAEYMFSTAEYNTNACYGKIITGSAKQQLYYPLFLELFEYYFLPDYFGTPMILCVYSDKSFFLFFVNRN